MPPENNDPMRALDGLLSDPEMLSKIQTIARQFSATSNTSADAPSSSRHHRLRQKMTRYMHRPNHRGYL